MVSELETVEVLEPEKAVELELERVEALEPEKAVALELETAVEWEMG